MRILVTGGTGLIGSAIREIVDNFHKYTFLSSKDCDLKNEVAVIKLFNEGNFDIVIHLAARVGGLYNNLDNNYDMLVDNIKINTNILEYCKKYKIKRLINILSTCIFGNNLQYPLTSDQMYNKEPDFSNLGYATAKRLLDIGSKLLSNKTNTDIQIVNLIPTNLYGYNDNFNLHNAHVIPNLLHKTYIAKQNNSKLHIKGEGKSYRQFVLDTDFAKIILHFVNCTLNKPFNQLIIGPPVKDEITIRDLVNKITSNFKFKGEIIYDDSFPEGQNKKTVSNSELLEYIPDFKFTQLDTGLKNTIKYFIENFNIVRK
jgi:GDP-L-fucose synthase